MPKKKSVRTPKIKKQDDKRGTNPNSLANLQPPWKPGIPSPNPGGRPKLLSDAYREWLSATDPETGNTNAQLVAQSQGLQSILGETQAAKELRQATEGDTFKLSTWQTELVDALKAGHLTTEQVVSELGQDDARVILIAAGQTFIPSPQSKKPNESESNIQAVDPNGNTIGAIHS